jgi:DNA-binding GntR family transcriptional regulator
MKKTILNIKSLKEQVYEYLREEFRQHKLKPGAIINIDETSKELGISRTPLRDALLQLEIEGFVTIIPRRGIYVNKLTLDEIRDFYHVIGTLEYSAILACTDRIKIRDIERMAKLNEEMKKALDKDDFDLFYEKNLSFHNTYIDLTQNNTLIKIVNNLKKRLYDLPRPEKWIKKWEENSTSEHDKLVEFLRNGDFEKAARHIQDVHWSFEVHQQYIKKYYRFADN